MITEKVFSPVLYKGKDVKNAPFWNNAYKDDEVSNDMLNQKKWYIYYVKFDGLTPIMITKIKEAN